MVQGIHNSLLRRNGIYRSSDYHIGDITTSAHVAALQAGINAAANAEFVWDRAYNITNRAVSAVSGIFTHSDGCRMIGNPNLPIDLSPAGTAGDPRYIIRASGTAGTSYPLTVNAAVGDQSVTVAAASVTALVAAGMKVGDWVNISSDRLFIPGGQLTQLYGENSRVTVIGATSITVEPIILSGYLTADNAKILLLTMKRHQSVEGLRLIGAGQLDITGPNPTPIGDRGFQYTLSDGLRLEEVETHLCDNAGIQLYSCPDTIIRESRIFFQEQNGRLANQYGICPIGPGSDILIDHCTITNGKHGIVQSDSGVLPAGVTRRMRVTRNVIQGTWNAAVATHEACAQVDVVGNRMINCNAGIEAGCAEFYSEGNDISLLPYGNIGAGIFVSSSFTKVSSRGDRIKGGRFGFRANTTVNPIYAGGLGPAEITIDDMTVTDASNAAIDIVYDGTGARFNFHVRSLRTRGIGFDPAGNLAGAVSVKIYGSAIGLLNRVSLHNLDLQAATGVTAACVHLNYLNEVRISDVNYSTHAAPLIQNSTDVISTGVQTW